MRGAPAGTLDPRTLECPGDDSRNGTMRIKGAQRSSTAEKHQLELGSRSAVLQVIDDGLADFLTQR